MTKLQNIEKERRISLPEIYKDFYKLCASHIPKELVGTDLINKYPDLNEAAIELLQENGVENFLGEDDFVFMMHQGYIFWYFKADENTDPIVFGYFEKKLIPDELGTLSDFLKEYL